MVSGWARRNDGGVTPSYLLQVRPFSCIVYTMLVWSYQIVQTIEREDAMLVPTEIEGKAYLTQREASKYLGIARETFRKHIPPPDAQQGVFLFLLRLLLYRQHYHVQYQPLQLMRAHCMEPGF